METKFIDNLRNRKTNFPAPEEAIDKANACNLLSRDIYTDNTRFLYELLQNADDASCKSGALKFQIDFIEDYMIVSHEGKPFNEDDIESICSIGDGSKSADSEQTGFKGIGFKSVFAYSDLVIIKSGDYCFKFDKQESSDVWLDVWGNQEEWQQKRKLKNKSTKVNLPWQIIPINSLLPDGITSNIVNGFNVSTIIRCKKINELKESVKNLFSSAELILFLRSQKVEIIVNTDSPLHIVKQNIGEITSIARDGEIINEWLMHTTIPFEVPSGVREQMEEDKDHYPEKLREATKASISFAISIKDGRIEKLDSQINNIYSFLPTSVKHYKFPFIVNSNFITDAGRQNLHQDYVWNQWLFEAIPNHFLNWICNIASSGKYGLDFLKVISLKSGATDELGSAYNKTMKEVLPITPILPNTNGILTTSEAILDKTSISSAIGSQFVIRYLNNESTAYCTDNILLESYLPYASKLKELGTIIFDEEELKEMISSDWFIASQNPTENSKLIRFLSAKYAKHEDSMESLFWLQNTPFLFTQSERMLCPAQVCFPNLTTNESGDVDIIHSIVLASLQEVEIDWLKNVGVKEISDTSIIDTGKLFEEGFITQENALKVGEWIFNLYTKLQLNEFHFSQLKEMRFLTKGGNLKYACELYLSDDYNPEISLEKHTRNEDLFISSHYLRNTNSISLWKLFLLKIGVKCTIKLDSIRWEEKVNSNFQELKKSWEKSKEIREFGYHFQPRWYLIEYYPLITIDENNYDLSCIIWSYLLQQEYIMEDKSRIRGHIGNFWSYNHYDNSREPTLNSLGIDSFRRDILTKYQKFPTTTKEMLLAKDIYVNTPSNIDLCLSYIPVLNTDSHIHESWLEILPLKRELQLNDLLLLLTHISQDSNKLTNNQERIVKIYNRIIDTNLSEQSKQEIIEWSHKNRILAENQSFYSPAELMYTTLDGFISKRQVYIRKIENKDKLIELLKLFGVKIYTEENIDVQISGEQTDTLIQPRLLSVLPILALLASDGHDETYFKTKCADLQSLIENNTFCSCDSIKLVFRDATGEADRLTYATKDHFYYTGKLTASKMEPLLSPLCALLGIKGKERELFVIMVENDYDAILEFLREKDYKVQWISGNNSTSANHSYNSAQIGGAILNAPPSKQQIAENCEAKALVLDRLSCMGFDVDNVEESCSLINGVKLAGKDYPLVVKSCKNYHHRMHLNPSEWQQLFKPNSMLWVHLGNRIVVPIKAFDLLTYQDRVTLSFGSVNLLEDDRVHKIMHVMKYFNDVHLDIASMDPNTNRGEALDDILFNGNNLANSDLGEDISIKF